METAVVGMSVTLTPQEHRESLSLGPIQTPLGNMSQGAKMPKAQRLKSTP